MFTDNTFIQPVMSCIVAFHVIEVLGVKLCAVMLLQGADLASVEQIFEWLRQEIAGHNRDVGFCGNTEDTVQHAISLHSPHLITQHR